MTEDSRALPAKRFISHNGKHRRVAEWMAEIVREAGDEAIVMTPEEGDDEPAGILGGAEWMRRCAELLMEADSLIYVHKAYEQPNPATASEIEGMGKARKPIEELIFFDDELKQRPVWRRASTDVFDVMQPGPEGAYFDPPLDRIDLEWATPPLRVPHPNNRPWADLQPDVIRETPPEDLPAKVHSRLDSLAASQGVLDFGDILSVAISFTDRYVNDMVSDHRIYRQIHRAARDWVRKRGGPELEREYCEAVGEQSTDDEELDELWIGSMGTVLEAMGKAVLAALPEPGQTAAIALANPKTAALLFDRVWSGGRDDFPAEIAFRGATRFELTMSMTQAAMDAFPTIDGTPEQRSELIHRAKMGMLREMQDPSTGRPQFSRRLAQELLSEKGIEAAIVYADRARREIELGPEEVVTSLNVPIPDEGALSWEQVLALRADRQSCADVRSADPARYLAALRRHGISTVDGVIERTSVLTIASTGG